MKWKCPKCGVTFIVSKLWYDTLSWAPFGDIRIRRCPNNCIQNIQTTFEWIDKVSGVKMFAPPVRGIPKETDLEWRRKIAAMWKRKGKAYRAFLPKKGKLNDNQD